MRHTKFRGYSKFKPEWWYGNLNYNRCLFEGEDDRVWIAGLTREAGNVNQFLNLCHFTEVYPESVGQFTGLHDKNGKEAYDGDIYKAHDGSLWVICADNLGVWADKLPERITWTRDFTPSEWEKDCEIIGNIYENPDLLK